jgi:hypothetical protein
MCRRAFRVFGSDEERAEAGAEITPGNRVLPATRWESDAQEFAKEIGAKTNRRETVA